MIKKFNNGLIFLAALVFIAQIGFAQAQEHPSEHPHHGQHGHNTTDSNLTKDSLADAITKYVHEDSELKGGYFLVYDDVDKTPLVLTLDKVHRERLSSLGNDTYFACADFKTPDGKMYDLDIFMKGKDAKKLKVTEILVHKESGEARYTWHEKDGVWHHKAAK